MSAVEPLIPHLADHFFSSLVQNNTNNNPVAAAGGFNLTLILLPLLVVLALGLGTTVELDAFKQVLSTPRAFIALNVGHYITMPLVAGFFVAVLNLSTDRAFGLMLVGFMPIATSSPLFVYWARGNMALAFSSAFASTVASFFMIPILTIIYSSTSSNAKNVKIDFVSLMASLLALVIPCAIGVFIRHKNTEKKIAGKFIWQWTEIIGSAIGAIFLIIAIAFGVKDNIGLLSESFKLYVVGVFFEPIGDLLALAVCYFAGCNWRDTLTSSLINGTNSPTIAIAIATLTFSDETQRKEILAYPLFIAAWYVIHGIILPLVYRFVMPKSDDITVTTTNSKDLPDLELASKA